ncbi:MAG: RNA degradosome polyphosphate kinase, partial [Solirubrobacterales bacterium]
LDNRVELLTPINDPDCRAQVLDDLDRCLADNTNSWVLRSDGSWERLSPGPGEEPRNVQRESMALALVRVAEAAAAQ